jgi:hypothetical protein
MCAVVALHWSLMLTLAIACFIVRVMKGPVYVADAYPLPNAADADPVVTPGAEATHQENSR